MFQHLCQWTRVDIQPATQRLAQYQNAPGELHFHSLLHLAKYLRSHPDLPLAFCRRPTSIPDHPLFDVSSVAGAGCWLGEPTVSNVEAHQFPGNETFWNETRTVGALTHSLSLEALKSLEEKHFCSLAPTTEGQVDANFGGAVFDRLAYSGGVILMNGTAVVTVCAKQSTTAYNTTEAELDAATTISKRVQWIRIFLADLGFPYEDAIPIGEDNRAAQTIAHAGKLTRNVRHIATKTAALQEQVVFGRCAFTQVATDDNRSDHFTKALPIVPHRAHNSWMMGLRFIDAAHRAATAAIYGNMLPPD